MATDIPEYYVTLSYLYGLFDYLADQSLDQEPLLQAINLPADALNSPDMLLPVDSLDIACDMITTMTGDPLAAYWAGKQMRPSHLGIVGHMMLCCNSLEELALLASRYGRLISNGARIDLVNDDGALSLHIHVATGRKIGPCRTSHDYNLGGWITMCQWLGGEEFSPRYMEYECPEDYCYDPIREDLDCEIRFDSDRSLIALASGKQTLNVGSVDPGVRSMVEASLQQRLSLLESDRQQHDASLNTIVDLICAKLPDGTPDLESIAACTDQTPRQLRYALKNKHTTFKELVDTSRRSMALKHIADPALPLIDVALLLGFSDQTAFHKAFKRWFDKSPGEYRKSLANH